jgi:hypothetical protein
MLDGGRTGRDVNIGTIYGLIEKYIGNIRRTISLLGWEF